MEHRTCWNCGNLMIWNWMDQLFICQTCGNSEDKKDLPDLDRIPKLD